MDDTEKGKMLLEARDLYQEAEELYTEVGDYQVNGAYVFEEADKVFDRLSDLLDNLATMGERGERYFTIAAEKQKLADKLVKRATKLRRKATGLHWWQRDPRD